MRLFFAASRTASGDARDWRGAVVSLAKPLKEPDPSAFGGVGLDVFRAPGEFASARHSLFAPAWRQGRIDTFYSVRC